jgi:GNAT superfamily N-acetyltransferase
VAAPIEGLSVHRTAGINGTRLSALIGGDVIGYIEVETFDAGERLPRHGGWADIGNLRVTEPYRRRGVASWLPGQAADWLRLADVDRLTDSSTTPGSTAPTPAAWTTRTTALSFPQPA